MPDDGLRTERRYPSFSEPSEPAEWVYTTAGRTPCATCGEWVYTRRPVDGETFAFPPECQVCGAPIKIEGDQ